MASRRVGFGDEPPKGRGGWSWAVLLALGILLAAAAAVLDPTLWERVQGWASDAAEDGVGDIAKLLPWLVVVLIAGGAIFILRGLFAAIAGRSGQARPGTPAKTIPAKAPRRRARRRAGNWEDDRGEERPPEQRASAAAKQPGGWFAIVFLIVWLCGWTFGIVFAIGAFISESSSSGVGPHLFLLVWIAFALVGWVVAFGILIGLLRDALSKR